jgi:hypothetical protein
VRKQPIALVAQRQSGVNDDPAPLDFDHAREAAYP